MPRAAKIEQFAQMVRHSRADLFDQATPVGRLCLVQVAMLAGDTLVTISLAGSLFFSIIVPVVEPFTLPQGDTVMAVLAAIGGLTYITGRRALR